METLKEVAAVSIPRKLSQPAYFWTIVITIKHSPGGGHYHGYGNAGPPARENDGQLRQSVVNLGFHGEVDQAESWREDSWVWVAIGMKCWGPPEIGYRHLQFRDLTLSDTPLPRKKARSAPGR